MSNHWLFRIGDGGHFRSSMKHKIWGINSKHPWCQNFMKKVKSDDILWFITSNSQGLIYGLSKFKSFN